MKEVDWDEELFIAQWRKATKDKALKGWKAPPMSPEDIKRYTDMIERALLPKDEDN
jgi:hypothetical protein